MAKISEWQGGGGSIWHAADISDLGHKSGSWYHIPRVLNIPLDEYVKILIQEYKVDYINLSKNGFLNFYWKEYRKCHKFVLDMNKKLKALGKYG